MSTKEMIQDLGLLWIFVKQTSGSAELFDLSGSSLVEMVWFVVKANAVSEQFYNQAQKPPLFNQVPLWFREQKVVSGKNKHHTLELEIYCQQNPAIN